MAVRLSRREMIARSSSVLGAGVVAGLTPAAAAIKSRSENRFRYSLNTSTIQGQRLTVAEEVEIAARLGYDAIEPWIQELDAYVKAGGSLKDLGKRIHDRGLAVESAIGFFEWIVDDDNRRAKGLEEARRNMAMVQQIGGLRIAAPPAGATDRSDIDPLKAAERYRSLLEIGQGMGVTPQVEVWGFSRTLGRLGEAAMVAIQSDHPQACVLPDVFHLYKGGSGFVGMGLLSSSAVHTIHLNDYPADPPREKITDADRVYPGDGVAPLETLFHALRQIGYQGVLSLELFNREYWQHDALLVARTGLEKMRAVAERVRE